MSQTRNLPPRAIVLAAGRGSRLGGEDGPPKPLATLLGRRLIDYTLASIAAAGIPEAVVVTGYAGKQVRDVLSTAAHPGLQVRCIENIAWDGPASTSLRAAREAAGDEPFVLMMSDHVPSPEFVARFLEVALPGVSSVAVDRSPRPPAFVEEATLVEIDDKGLVRSIGKGLGRWAAIDAGAFLLQPGAWVAVDDSPERCELSRIFGRLAETSGLHAADISGAGWYDVDTLEDLDDAARYLTDRQG
jgi:choline kinase